MTAVELSDYFTDPDLPADELSYAARSNDESVATVSVSGSMLTVEGLKLGATYVSVTVTDPGRREYRQERAGQGT